MSHNLGKLETDRRSLPRLPRSEAPSIFSGKEGNKGETISRCRLPAFQGPSGIMQIRKASGEDISASADAAASCSGLVSTRSFCRSDRGWGAAAQTDAVTCPSSKYSTSPRRRPIISSVSVERACVTHVSHTSAVN
eukprot:TRINITY_DN988_c0_g2_i1.p1 TRINITY_DN988_c0_g2~~TRINITY_DN988_c0_g2_i1.p1  ORF type:complete len:136 (-),score=2.91 TRINITY_DN988_c0_g2_i1:304-711(-)